MSLDHTTRGSIRGSLTGFSMYYRMNSKGKEKRRKGKSKLAKHMEREDTDSPVPRPSGAMAVETAHPVLPAVLSRAERKAKKVLLVGVKVGCYTSFKLGGDVPSDVYIDSLLDKIGTLTRAYRPSASPDSAIPMIVGGRCRSGFWRDACSQQFSFESHNGTNKVGQATLYYTLMKTKGHVRYSGVAINVTRNQYCDDVGHYSSNDFIGCTQQPEFTCMMSRRKVPAIESGSGPQAESHCVFHTPSRYSKQSPEHILAVQIIKERMPIGTASWLTEKETMVSGWQAN